MGSGRGGLHGGTWGSREGEELRSRVNDVLKQFGGSAAGDAAAEIAEALVRVAMGDSPEETVPEPGEVAFDLALDALSPFVPGGGKVTRELAAAARKKGPSNAFLRAVEKGIVSDKSLEENAEFANEMFRMTEAGNFGDGGKSKDVRCIYTPDPMADSLELFERLSRGAKDDPSFDAEIGTRRWLSDRSSVVHRRTTSTPGSPAVEISPGDTVKIKKQKVHFVLEE